MLRGEVWWVDFGLQQRRIEQKSEPPPGGPDHQQCWPDLSERSSSRTSRRIAEGCGRSGRNREQTAAEIEVGESLKRGFARNRTGARHPAWPQPDTATAPRIKVTIASSDARTARCRCQFSDGFSTWSANVLNEIARGEEYFMHKPFDFTFVNYQTST